MKHIHTQQFHVLHNLKYIMYVLTILHTKFNSFRRSMHIHFLAFFNHTFVLSKNKAVLSQPHKIMLKRMSENTWYCLSIHKVFDVYYTCGRRGFVLFRKCMITAKYCCRKVETLNGASEQYKHLVDNLEMDSLHSTVRVDG